MLPTAAVPTSTKAPPRASLRLVVLLGALTAIAPLSIDMYLPGLPDMTGDLSAAAAQVQLTLTACVVGLSVGQVIAGPLSDSWGRRRPLLIGMVAYAAASVLCALAPSVQTLTALRLVQGLTGAAGIVIARAIVSDMYEGAAAARFFSTLMLVNGLAPIAAPVLGGQLLQIMPWRGIFGVLAVLGTLMFLAALATLRETLPPEHRSRAGPRTTLAAFRVLITDRSFLGYSLGGGLGFAAMFTYISGSPFVLQDIYGLSAQMFSLVFALNAVGIIAVGQLTGRLTHRVPLRRLLGTGLGIVAIGGIALLVSVLAGAGLPGVLPSLFLLVSGQGMVLPTASALALSGRPPGVTGSASALLGLVQFAIGGALAPLAGIAGEDTAVPMAATIAAASLAAAAAARLAKPA